MAVVQRPRSEERDGWPLQQAADGDREALAELVERRLDELYAVVRYLEGGAGAVRRTAEIAATAPGLDGWSSEEELTALLLRKAVRSNGVPPEGEPDSGAGPSPALALVELARRTPDDAAGDLEIPKGELLEQLARARIAARRARKPLAGGGRCLRARRLLSHSLDEALGDLQARMLQAHLDNCPRCVEHEALLNEELASLYGTYRVPAPGEARQAVRDALVGGAVEPAGAPPPAPRALAPSPARPVPELKQETDQPTVPTGGESPGGGKVGAVAEEEKKQEEPTSAEQSKDEEAPEEAAGGEGDQDLDAMGLDKRRGVVGQSYGPTLAKQAALYGGVLVVIILAFFGISAAVDSLDKAPKTNPDKAPWSKPKDDAPAIGVDCLGAPREACLETSRTH